MFDYSYWPKELPQELKKQIKNFTHKAQLVLDGDGFLLVGNDIIKAQMNDKYFELLVFLPKGFRTLEVANLLHRIVQGGAIVGVFEVEIMDDELEQYGIFDNKVLMSDVLHGQEGGVFPLILQKHGDFQKIMDKSLPVTAAAQEIKMSFAASKYFVAKGQQVELSWRAENAQSICLNPGNTELEPTGREVFVIENDTLFTITSRNTKSKNTVSIFIKCLEEEQWELIVSVFNRDLNTYVKVDPISEGVQSYAVYKGDLLRIEWTCPAASIIKEETLGPLKNRGFHNFICLENREFNFEILIFNGSIKKQIKIYPLTETGEFVDTISKTETSLAFAQNENEDSDKGIHWTKKLMNILKIRKNNDHV